jgi:hypothetical protein
MIRHLAGLVLACMILAGCAAAPPTAPLTPAQAYHAADRTYETVLTAAVEYHEDCLRTPDPFKGRCREVVHVMRQVNREAQDIRVLGELALASNDDDLLTEATDHLETLRDRLRQQVLDQMARDDQLVKRGE